MAAADLTTRPPCRAFADRVNSPSRCSTLLRPRNRLWSGSVAHHRDHLEVLVELDVVLLVLALGVIDFKVALPSVSFSILPPVQQRSVRQRGQTSDQAIATFIPGHWSKQPRIQSRPFATGTISLSGTCFCASPAVRPPKPPVEHPATAPASSLELGRFVFVTSADQDG